MKRPLFLTTLTGAFFLLPLFSPAQLKTEAGIENIAREISGHVGVYAVELETGKDISFHGDQRFPMQSVYKFPIAMAVLSKVDSGRLSLDQKIHVVPSDFIPSNGHSPLRDKYPQGITLTLGALLRYSVAESDGTASDVLLRILGGTREAQKYIHGLGVQEMAIATTEGMQVAHDTIQYRNWTTPKAMSRLFGLFYSGGALSAQSKGLLITYMSPSSPFFNRRINGLLPKGTPFIHKTGTSGTIHGLTRATNDAGIITLPNGKHIALSVFISDSYSSLKERETAIAQIGKWVFDQFTGRD